MTFLNIDTVEADVMAHIESVVINPRVTDKHNHTLKVQGVMKNRAPYIISFTFEADRIGGVEVKAAILPFFGLMNKAYGQDTQVAQVRYDDIKKDWSLEMRATMKFLIRKLNAYAQLTATPPKGLDRAALIQWTFEHSRTIVIDPILDHFEKYDI